MAPKLPPFPPHRAFVHVCNDHRWLARAADNWARLATPNAEQASFAGTLDRFLPDVRVAIQSSALHYARSLIEFYAPRNPKKQKPEDIRISDFDTAVSCATSNELWKYKAAIDVHLLHLTAWRDPDYRVMYRDWGGHMARCGNDGTGTRKSRRSRESLHLHARRQRRTRHCGSRRFRSSPKPFETVCEVLKGGRVSFANCKCLSDTSRSWGFVRRAGESYGTQQAEFRIGMPTDHPSPSDVHRCSTAYERHGRHAAESLSASRGVTPPRALRTAMSAAGKASGQRSARIAR